MKHPERQRSDDGHAHSLRAAFLEDHRAMTRGFKRALDAVEANRMDDAVRAADDVDRVAGAHIAFEETVLYPRLREIVGDTYVDQLFDEHGEGRKAIASLLEARDGAADESAVDRGQVVAQLQTALDHAVTCGTLLSHVDAFSSAEQESMLARLLALRAGAPRWCAAPAAG